MQNALEITAMPSQASAASMSSYAYFCDFPDQYEALLYSRFMIEDTDLPTEIERWLESPDTLTIDDMIPKWKHVLRLVPHGTYPVKVCSCLQDACIGCEKVYMMTDCRTSSLVEATFTFSTLPTPESRQVIEARELDNSRSYFQTVEFANAVVRSHSMQRALKEKKFSFIYKYGYGAMREGDYDLAMAFLRKHGEIPEIFKEPVSSSPSSGIVAQIADIHLNLGLDATTTSKLDSLLDMVQSTLSAFTMKAGHITLLSSIAINLVWFFKSGCTFTSLCFALANVVMTIGIPSDLVADTVSQLKDLASQAYSYFFPNSPDLPPVSFSATAQGPAETLLPLGSLVVSVLSVGLLKKLPNASDLTAYAQHFSVFGRAVQGLKSITDVVQEIVLKSFAWCYERWYGMPYELKDYTATVPELQEYFNSVSELVALDEKKKIQNDVSVCKRVEDVYTKGLGIQRRLANIKAPSQVMTTFSTHHMIMTKLYSEVDKSGAFNSGPRVPPVVVQLFGGSGVGKSGCAFPLMQDVLRVDGLHTDWANHIYQRNTEQDFWDGYDNQRICYYDDFGQLRDNQTAPNAEFMEIIRTANIAPYPLHRAELTDKARSRFTSRLVLLTSNCQTFPTPSLTCPQAFLRRIDFAYKVEIDDRVAFRHVFEGRQEIRIDPELVRQVYGVPMTTEIYKFYRVNKQTLQPGQDFINYQQMIAEITQAYRSRFHENNNIVNFLNQRVAQVNDEFFDTSEDYVRYDSEYLRSYFTESDELEFSSHGFTSSSSEDLQAVVNFDLSDAFAGMQIEELKLTERVFLLKRKEAPASSRVQWLKSKAGECLQTLSEFAQYVLEKAKLNPVRTVLVAAAVLVPLILRFWPRSKNECKMGLALQKVLAQDTHWNIYNAFGTRTCFRKCDVCDALKAGGMPTMGPQDSVRDVIARMIAKLRHIPPFGDEILVESNDCLTKKVSAVVESMKESVDTPAKVAEPEVNSYNPNNTIKVALPSVEAASDDVIGQGLLDVNAQELFQSKVLRNTYRITRERSGKHTVLMNLTFIKGVCAVTAGHILNHLQDGDVIHLTNIYLKSISLPWKSVQVVSPSETDQDVCLLVFPRDFMPMQVDISKHFVDDHHLVEVSGGSITLVTFRKANILGMKDVPSFLNCPRVEAHNKTITYADTIAKRTVQQRDYYSYQLDTQSGDCGSMIGVRTNMIPRKLIGLHVAGQPGVGYAVPLSQKRIQALLSAVPTLAQVSMDIDFTPANPPPGDFLPLFSVPPSETATSGSKSFLVQTPLFDVLEKHTMERAHLRPVGDIDPMEKSLEKAGGDLVYVDPCKIQKAENAVKHKLNPSGSCKVLTHQQAIEGIIGDEWICPVNRMASAGYPWVRHADGNPGKTKWLGKGEKYCFDNAELLAEVNKAEEMMKRGERPLFIFQDTLKDEKRPVEKVESVKTRTFAACPLPLVLLFRKYFLDAVKSIMVGRNHNEVAVGTNVYSMDWSVIARLLSSKGDKVIAGDFSNFDGSLQPQILRAVERILETFYQDVATPDETMIRSMLFNEVVNSIHIRGRDVYMWTHSQPSGGPLTVIINSLYNAIVMRLCWIDIMGEQYTMRDFDRCVALDTYGDDNVANISDEVIDTYNQETISEAMKSFGMTYTDESKSGKIVPWRRLSDVSFLKRKFVRRGFFYDAPLETRTLHEMVQWTRRSVDIHDATAVTVEGAALEWAMHGKEVYDHQVDRLRAACKAHLHKQPFLLTFEEVLQELDGHKC